MTQKQTDTPALLKLSFLVFGLACAAYLVSYMGGGKHSGHGSLVRAFDAATHAADALMWVVCAVVVIYLVTLATYTLGKSQEEE
jgi:hypothetical protein